MVGYLNIASRTDEQEGAWGTQSTEKAQMMVNQTAPDCCDSTKSTRQGWQMKRW
jgi:hypothetical protein